MSYLRVSVRFWVIAQKNTDVGDIRVHKCVILLGGFDMSGGVWEYKDGLLMNEIYGYGTDTPHQARESNPLGDPEISELVWDVFNLLHSCDYWLSGDYSKAEYIEDVYNFKEKWFDTSGAERAEHIVDEEINIMKKRISEQLRSGG